MEKPSEADYSENVPQLLSESEELIQYLIRSGGKIPEEAAQLVSVLKRCIYAEEELTKYVGIKV